MVFRTCLSFSLFWPFCSVVLSVLFLFFFNQKYQFFLLFSQFFYFCFFVLSFLFHCSVCSVFSFNPVQFLCSVCSVSLWYEFCPFVQSFLFLCSVLFLWFVLSVPQFCLFYSSILSFLLIGSILSIPAWFL